MAPAAQQIVRDTFARANSGNLGANWTANSDATTTGTLGIVSNAAQAAVGGNAASFWNANTFTANQYSQLVINGSASGSGSQIIGPTVHDSAGGYYRFTYNTNNSDPSVQIAKVVSGTFTSLGAVAHGSCTLGSLLRLEIIGTQLTGYCNGTQMIQVSDSALATGNPGIAGFMSAASPTAFTQNWEGGNLLWTRQGTVIPVGANGGSQEPSVAYEANPQILSANADGKIWKQWFTNGWNSGTLSIFYAESADGVTWTQYSSNPVITDGANNPAHFSVVHIGNTYYGFVGDSVNFSLGLSRWTSSNGLTGWTKTNSGVLLKGSAGTWEDIGVFNPIVWDVGDGTWNMLYTGRTSVGSSLYGIGLASSSDLGVTWTKFGSNPIIAPGPSPNNGKIVIKNGNLYYMWGFIGTTSSLLPTDHALYTSPDLHTWTACAKNPIYLRVLSDEGAGLSSGQVADPVMIEHPLGTTNLFYDAVDIQVSGHIHNNLATAPFSIYQILGMVSGNNIIAGNVGVAGATVNYSGAGSGSVFSDSFGNYVIPILTNGSYTIAPAAGGFNFNPATSNQTVSSADINNVNFTAVPSGGAGGGVTGGLAGPLYQFIKI